MRVLLVREGREFLCAPGEEIGTDLGVLSVPADVAPGDVVETHLGEPFRVVRPRGPALFRNLERSGAPMRPRDVGLVVGHLGLETGDAVLDAGTGTGVLAIFLGRLGMAVTTYERDSAAAETARDNVRRAGVEESVAVRTGDILDSIDALATDEPFDALTLDTQDAPAVVEAAPTLLVPGGVVAVYAPFVEGARAAVEAAAAVDLASIDTYETIQRKMEFDERGSRPSTAPVGHSGYLTFAQVP